MGANHYNKSLQVRGRYNHFNGNSYYSLFQTNGTWLGYINSNATTAYKPKQTQSTEIINIDTNNNTINSTNGYTYVSKKPGNSKTITQANGDKHTTYTIVKIWEKKKDIELELDTPTYSLNMTSQFETAINNYRLSQNIYSLEVNQNSRLKSEKTASKNISSDWTSWSASHAGEQIGTTWSSSKYFTDSGAVQQAMNNFINSFGHKENLLEHDKNFAEYVGASVYSMRSLDSKTGTIIYSYLFIATIDTSW